VLGARWSNATRHRDRRAHARLLEAVRDSRSRRCKKEDAAAGPERAVDPRMRVIAFAVRVGNARAFTSLGDRSTVVTALLFRVVVRNAMRERCYRCSETARKQDD
jgi:hypothetical protein